MDWAKLILVPVLQRTHQPAVCIHPALTAYSRPFRAGSETLGDQVPLELSARVGRLHHLRLLVH